MASRKPLDPYNIMLCHVSKHIKGDLEMMHGLGRMMGCQDTSDVSCPSLLFSRLEKEGVLSEFDVNNFRNALEHMDLPRAAIIVKEYEDRRNGQKNEAAPPTGSPHRGMRHSYPCPTDRDNTGMPERPISMPPSYREVVDKPPASVPMVSSSGTGYDEAGDPANEGAAATEGDIPKDEEERKGELTSMDFAPEQRRRKYHTVNQASLKRDYPDYQCNMFQKGN